MKVNIQKMKSFIKRFIPVLTAVLVFVCCISFPASALFSYEDYISNLEVDGENEIITVTLPVDRTMLQVWNTDWSVIARENGSSISFSAGELATYHFGIYPMYGDTLRVSDLPNGSTLTFSYSISDSSPGYQTPTSFGEFTYYNGAGVELRNDRVAGPTQAISDTYSFTFTLNKPDSADNCSFMLNIGNFVPYYSGRVTLIVKEVKMGISISALYRQQQLTGKTNKLLDEVNRQLEEQGKTMNDILNGTPGQQDKVDNVVGDIEDSLDDFQNSMDDMADATLPTIDFDEYVPFELLGQPFIHFANVLGSFWWNSVLARFMSILGGIILISFILFGEKH